MDEEKPIEINNDNVEKPEAKGKSITSLVLGIISVVTLCFTSYTMWISLICGILGLIFGILGMKNENAKSMAKTGVILSVIALVVVVVVILILIGIVLLGMGGIFLSAMSAI